MFTLPNLPSKCGKIHFLSKKTTFFSVLITLTLIVSMWPFSGAEDIINARENVYFGDKTDFWGGFAQFFYSLWKLPSPYWHIAMGVFHAILLLLGTLIAFKLFLLSRYYAELSLLVLVLHYFSTAYVLNLSRDGTLLSFVWCGFAFFSKGVCLKTKFNKHIFAGIVLLILGLSFRPWVAVGLTLIVIIGLRKSYATESPLRRNSVLIIGAMLITILPISLDIVTREAMGLKSSYPEQQVMIMDLSSIACLSPSRMAQTDSLKALEKISVSPSLDRETLCGQFYPQNWASTTFYSEPESPALRLIGVNEHTTYKQFREMWINIMIAYPVDYVQIKTLQLSQFFFAGESASFALNRLTNIVVLPNEIFQLFRLFSFFPILVLFMFLIFIESSKPRLKLLLAFFISYLISIAAITIAFIGDNQRYISWLPLLHFFVLLMFYMFDEKVNK